MMRFHENFRYHEGNTYEVWTPSGLVLLGNNGEWHFKDDPFAGGRWQAPVRFENLASHKASETDIEEILGIMKSTRETAYLEGFNAGLRSAK
jgi:hypothetical protein